MLALEWDGQYQLSSLSANGATAESYGYDALGRRVYIAQGTSTNWMVYDGMHVIADVNGTGGLVRSYVWGPGVDNLLAMTVYSGGSTSTYYALTDHLGTVHALADSSGSIVESYRFDAWGRVLGVYGSDGQPIAESVVGNRYLWQGREYSWATGLYFFRARWYEPITGRWLSNDPIGISGGLNQYVFCRNNPVNFRDPSGLCGDGDSPFIAKGNMYTLDISVPSAPVWLDAIRDAGKLRVLNDMDKIRIIFDATALWIRRAGKWRQDNCYAQTEYVIAELDKAKKMGLFQDQWEFDKDRWDIVIHEASQFGSGHVWGVGRSANSGEVKFDAQANTFGKYPWLKKR